MNKAFIVTCDHKGCKQPAVFKLEAVCEDKAYYLCKKHITIWKECFAQILTMTSIFSLSCNATGCHKAGSYCVELQNTRSHYCKGHFTSIIKLLEIPDSTTAHPGTIDPKVLLGLDKSK